MKRKLLALAVGGLMIATAGVAQAQEGSWIHIRVNEGDEGAKVNVNLPMSLIEVAMEIAQNEAFGENGFVTREMHRHEGDGEQAEGDHAEGDGMHAHFGDHGDLSIDDLRRMWAELRASGDADYVTAEDGDEHVRIYRRGDRVHIEVDEAGDQKVRMEVPFSVVDVLLQGEGNELNLVGAVREMARANNGQILTVNDGDTNVQIWIDNNPNPQG